MDRVFLGAGQINAAAPYSIHAELSVNATRAESKRDLAYCRLVVRRNTTQSAQ
jgi:hypothetical protein